MVLDRDDPPSHYVLVLPSFRRAGRTWARSVDAGSVRLEAGPSPINAALLATAILGNKHPQFRVAYEQFRTEQTQAVLQNRVPGNTVSH